MWMACPFACYIVQLAHLERPPAETSQRDLNGKATSPWSYANIHTVGNGG